MFRHCLFVMVVCTLLIGCAVTIKDLSKIRYMKEEFGPDSLKSGGIALLPLVVRIEQEGYRRPFTEALNRAVQSLRPELKFLKYEETMSLLSERGIVGKYQSAILKYRETAIIDKELLREIGEALGVRYVLFVTLEEVGKVTEVYYSFLWGPTTRTTTKVSAFAQIWDCSTGDIVWEGLGTAQSKAGALTTEKEYEEYCRIATRGLVRKLP